MKDPVVADHSGRAAGFVNTRFELANQGIPCGPCFSVVIGDVQCSLPLFVEQVEDRKPGEHQASNGAIHLSFAIWTKQEGSSTNAPIEAEANATWLN